MSYYEFLKLKTSRNEKYVCPKCSSRKIHRFHNDYYDMDIRYECQECKYITDNEMEFKSNYYTKMFDHLVNETKETLQEALPKLKEELKKEERMSKSMWDSYGSELAGDFADDEYTIRTKIKIIEGLLK